MAAKHMRPGRQRSAVLMRLFFAVAAQRQLFPGHRAAAPPAGLLHGGLSQAYKLTMFPAGNYTLAADDTPDRVWRQFRVSQSRILLEVD